jgi:hypothetical protein
MNNRIFKILPHAAIIISVMLIVIYIVDHVNGALGFMVEGDTQLLILGLCAVSIINSVLLVVFQRKRGVPRQGGKICGRTGAATLTA